MKKRIVYIGLFLIFIIGVISLIGTFAIDSTITEGNSSKADYIFNITLGDRTNREITIPSYDSKIVDIKISNPNEFNISYLLYLEGINSNISIINISDTEASGVLNSKNTNLIKVFIQNNSSSDITTSIKDIVGFEKETLSLPSNSTAINKGVYYKSIVKSNNKDYGKVKPNIKLSTKSGTIRYTLVPNTGYQYKSNTCNGTVANNILTISNITSNIGCEVVFEPIKVQVNLALAGGVVETTYTEPKEHTYIAPYTGSYKLETWGAQGGSYGSVYGGYGGYSTGQLQLNSESKLYINVGGEGGSVTQGIISGGYNGGGQSKHDNSNYYNVRWFGSGGGATHIATKSGLLKTLNESISSLLIVSGAGGGSYYSNYTGEPTANGGSGGGYIGVDGITSGIGGWGSYGTGGTQTQGGFNYIDATTCSNCSSSAYGSISAIGGFGYGGNNSLPATGGGSGYYGGGGSYHVQAAGGGSGYIGNALLTNKYMYCYNCATSSDTDTKTYTTTNVSSTPVANYAKGGNGAARITLISNASYTSTYNTKYNDLPTPTNDGYIFAGWYTGPDGTGTKVTNDTVLTNDSEHTLYAYWIKRTLYNYIKINADTTTQIDFSQTSETSNTNGIYMTANTDSGNPVYYYRGAVDNNHVLFANFCWRIVRTTETGGVKLIYDGKPTNGQCNNTGANTTIGNIQYNTNYNSPAYVGYMYNIAHTADSKDITKLSGNIVFGNDATYDTSTGKYTLKDTKTLTNPSNWGTEYSNYTDKYHYTCFSSVTTCQSVYYIHIIYSENKNAYYFTLTNGKKPKDLLNDMFEGNINVKESNAKVKIDAWYKANMTSYTSKLEDTGFCNDRTYYNFNTSGWNKDYSNYDKWLYFSSIQRLSNRKLSLVCPRQLDKFSVSADNGNGKLTYPVGMITAEEIAYAGGVIWQTNTSYYLYNGVHNWAFSPSVFSGWDAYEFRLYSSGSFSDGNVTVALGGRPVVSLKQGIAVASGSGTSSSPYVIQ